MSDKLQIVELLEEAMTSGRSPEEVCADYPELLDEVRERLSRIEIVRSELDSMFPESGSASAHPIPARRIEGGTPEIPGHEVGAVLGRGGMGVVFKARHLRLNRHVAVKMMLGGSYAGRRNATRFLREAEALAGLRHPNIVQVFDVGDVDGLPYFTMEFVEGGSLGQKLAGTPQPARQAAELLATLARAVQAAHSGGIVHRDLKPANVLLTADGTPKISDFGLARRLEGEHGLTWTGTPVGTPSYMAPEQAAGKSPAIGPAVDVYALGAILYELMTGRPPFRAETATETVLQVIYQEPAPPSRLNANVARDLETICLKCLHKDPQRRYATAGALAHDLDRFQRGESILARPAGVPERIGKWVRRHRPESVMLAVSVVLLVALVGGSLWYVAQQARRRDAIAADVRKVAELQESARWTEARAVLERAEARLGGGGLGDMRIRLAQARRDLDLVITLDAIRLKRLTHGELAFYKAEANADYASVFFRAGLGEVHDQPARVAARINGSAVRGALVDAVHDWAVCATDEAWRDWLFEVARHAEPDRDGWRDRILDRAAWDDRAALTESAAVAPERLPVSLLLALGEQLKAVGGDAPTFLKRVQKEHPADFWVNLILGNSLIPYQAPAEASGYYRAALASRPQAAVGYCAVGDALRLQNSRAEAIAYYRKALEIDPHYARAHSNLGLTLQAQDRIDDAIPYYETAVRLDPNYAWAHHNLGDALRRKGRLDEAHDQCQQALRLEPKNVVIQTSLNNVLLQQGRRQEAQVGWRKALDANPQEPEVWFGYAELCLFLGQQDEYRRVRRVMLERFGATTTASVAEPIGRACLLLPGSEDEVRKAVALTDRAVAAKESTPDWIYRYALFAKGLADYRQGRLESAISVMEGEASKVMGPAPRLILAMAQYDLGRKPQARRTLAKAVVAFDWSAAEADSRDVWIIHVLRREAETLILPNLSAFLQGRYQPADNDERLALVGICQSQGRDQIAARLCADAFESDPTLAEDLARECRYRAVWGDSQPVGRIEELTTKCRYPAARTAALAGGGPRRGDTKVVDVGWARWRKQACDWLRADLAVWTEVFESGSPAARVLVRSQLTNWLADPALAGLRGATTGLDELPPPERTEWRRLWSDVDALLKRANESK
jgi:eukaryotic-like serine/threonine-protein kinase